MATTLEAAPKPAQSGVINAEDALRIARHDAEAVYRHLSDYMIIITQENDGWHVDYEIKEPHIHGGGPHYIIDLHDGRILKKRYEQ